MKLSIVSPTKALLLVYSDEELRSLRKQLTYENTGIKHLIKRHQQNFTWKSRNTESWTTHLEGLQKDLKKCLVFEDEEDSPYIRPGSIPHLIGISVEVENNIKYPKSKAVMPWIKPLPFTLHPYQEESCTKLIAEKQGNVSLTTGCHAPGTGILMFDGTIKKVENIFEGDIIMGPDSKPRKILDLHKGTEEMYKISPIKGEPFVVNKGHILSLQRTNQGNTYLRKDGTRASQENGSNPILNISVQDYLTLPKNQKHLYKLYRADNIHFPIEKVLRIPPYILGAWLGDGNSANSGLTTMDDELKSVWCDYLHNLGLEIRIEGRGKGKAFTYRGLIKDRSWAGKEGPIKSSFNVLFGTYDLINNKHIPFDYLTSSRQDRLELLAGLIDTDGYHHCGGFEIIQKNKQLAQDILFLARSLGFCATQKDKISYDQNGSGGIYVRLNISGDLSTVPTKLKRKHANRRKQIKSVLRTGFSVSPVGIGSYYGFTVDCDNLYVLDDFTVTHNSGKSAILLKISKELGLNTCIVVPSKSIFEELVEKFEYHFGKKYVGTYGAGKKKLGKRFTIAIGDSLANIKPDSEEYKFFNSLDVLIADESHSFGAESLEEVCHGVLSNIPYRFFLSATQFRNDGSLPLLQSIIGKTVCELGTEEAVLKGYICPHEFRIVSVDSSNPSFQETDPLAIKRAHLLNNHNIANFIAKLVNATATVQGKQTLVLCEELSQLSMLVPLLKVPYALAHSERNAERLLDLGLERVDVQDSIEKFNKNEVKALLTTSCCHVGVNIYPTHSTAFWCGGASAIKVKQAAVGRSIRFGHSNPWASKCVAKDKAVIYDFDVYGNKVLARHLESRLECYGESGKDLIKFINFRKIGNIK